MLVVLSSILNFCSVNTCNDSFIVNYLWRQLTIEKIHGATDLRAIEGNGDNIPSLKNQENNIDGVQQNFEEVLSPIIYLDNFLLEQFSKIRIPTENDFNATNREAHHLSRKVVILIVLAG